MSSQDFSDIKQELKSIREELEEIKNRLPKPPEDKNRRSAYEKTGFIGIHTP